MQSYYKNSFSYNSDILWNSLPCDLREAETIIGSRSDLLLIQITVRDRMVNMQLCYRSIEIQSYPRNECGIQ